MKGLLAGLLTLLLMGTAVPSFATDQTEVFARLGGVSLLGDGPDYLDLGVGFFDVFNGQEALAGAVQLQFGRKLFFLGPILGALATVDGGAAGYLGLYADLAAGPLVLTPQTAVAAYEEGDGKDLGGTLEFISGASLAWRFESAERLGIRWLHISNADLHDENPGANLLLLHWSIGF